MEKLAQKRKVIMTQAIKEHQPTEAKALVFSGLYIRPDTSTYIKDCTFLSSTTTRNKSNFFYMVRVYTRL